MVDVINMTVHLYNDIVHTQSQLNQITYITIHFTYVNTELRN